MNRVTRVHSGRRTFQFATGTILVGALFLVGCGSQDLEPDNPETSTSNSQSPTPSTGDVTDPATSPDDSAAPVVQTVPIGNRQVEYAVGPLVRMDGLSILRIEAQDISATVDGEAVQIGSLWKGLHPGASGVRLFDAESLTVEETASTKHPIYSRGILEVSRDEPTQMYVVFGEQRGDTTNVILPFGGVFAEVPVVDEDAVESQMRGAFDDLVPDPSSVTSQVSDLSSFSVSLLEDLDTRKSADEVVVNLTADVLFSFDQAELSKNAEKALNAAVEKFDRYSGGKLTIVGHTDDQGEKGPNQKLSERRAQAVTDRLAELGDLDRFDVEVEGKGWSQPRAEGKSERARALNRRVELVLKPDGEVEKASPQEEATTELAKSNGPSAVGSEGVVVKRTGSEEVRVRLAEVTRVGETLVGEVHVEHVSGDVASVGPWFALGTEGIRGGFQPDQQYAPANLTLVVGDERIYPLDYTGVDDGDETVPMVDLFASAPLPEGGEYVLTAVWPDVAGENASDVVLDVENRSDDKKVREIRPPFRLTEVGIK